MSIEAEITALREEGYTDEEIAEDMGIPLWQVQGGKPPAEARATPPGGWSRPRVPDDVLIAHAKRLAEELGHSPTMGDWARSSPPISAQAVSSPGRFRSWAGFLAECDLPATSVAAAVAREPRVARPPARPGSEVVDGVLKENFGASAEPLLTSPEGRALDAARRLRTDERAHILWILGKFQAEDHDLEEKLSEMDGAGRVATALFDDDIQLSVASKVKRVAEAMARLRGQEWGILELEQRQKFIKLALFAVQAIAEVEFTALSKARQDERLGRAA